MNLPPLLPCDEILERLKRVIPEGIPGREYIVRISTARIVFSALYTGAIAGTDRWLAPRHVYRMTDALASVEDGDTRLGFYKKVPKSSEASWYADNSREQARDEGVRQGLVPLNAMVMRSGIDTTSSKGRYALHPDFAALLDPGLSGAGLDAAIKTWGATYLSGAALARAALLQGMGEENVTVNHPQGGSSVLPAGDSPNITKAVVEDFAKRFPGKPAVVWISDSKKKRFSDDGLEKVLQIELDVAKVLPDVILVDLAPPGRSAKLMIVFVEVVSSDGAISAQRREELLKLVAASPRGYEPDDAVFVMAYRDRQAPPAAKAMRQLAWRSFAWFMSEPTTLSNFMARAQSPERWPAWLPDREILQAVESASNSRGCAR